MILKENFEFNRMFNSYDIHRAGLGFQMVGLCCQEGRALLSEGRALLSEGGGALQSEGRALQLEGSARLLEDRALLSG